MIYDMSPEFSDMVHFNDQQSIELSVILHCSLKRGFAFTSRRRFRQLSSGVTFTNAPDAFTPLISETLELGVFHTNPAPDSITYQLIGSFRHILFSIRGRGAVGASPGDYSVN